MKSKIAPNPPSNFSTVIKAGIFELSQFASALRLLYIENRAILVSHCGVLIKHQPKLALNLNVRFLGTGQLANKFLGAPAKKPVDKSVKMSNNQTVRIYSA